MADESVMDIGSRRELFVDRELIEAMEGAELRLHHPQPAGVALRLDAPWEGAYAFYTTVLVDDGKFLMVYRGWPGVGEGHTAVTCLATSDDGITWARPELDLFEEKGAAVNNIILHEERDGSVCHNFAPFIDTRPGVPDAERFKGLGGSQKRGGLFGYVSADGMHWTRLRPEPLITREEFGFDSQNVAFWSEAEGCYVAYYRTFHAMVEDGETKRGPRWVSRRTSDDFLTWSDEVEMDPGDAPIEQMYVQQTHPYYRAPHIYLALAARFWQGRQVITEEQGREVGAPDHYVKDCSDTVLMTSRGGNRYDRTFMESFIRPGMGPEHWVSRTNYAACGVVATGPDEMSIYVNRRYTQAAAYVERMTLRPDGFASLHAGYGGGEMVTRPFTFTGAALELNLATSAAGGVWVEVQDAEGAPIAGYTLDDCPEIIGDELARVVAWKDGSDAAALASKPVRLRFVLKDADVYAFRFR